MNCMKRPKNCMMLLLCILLTFIPGNLHAQFEQKLSVNLSGGYFNTVGRQGYDPEWQTEPGKQEPILMSNFTGGYAIAGGLQYNHSRHFSIELQFGVLHAPGWYFDYSADGEEEFNYLYYEIPAVAEDSVVASGENDMRLNTIYGGIVPRYYLMPGKRVNPYLFIGLNFCYFDRTYMDREQEDYEALGRGDDYQPEVLKAEWFDDSFCLGFSGGIGAELAVSDILGIFAQATYYFWRLQDGAFREDMPKQAPFHGITAQAGVRISFLKSKEL